MDKPSPESLAAIQDWMQTVITHPDGVLAGIAVQSGTKAQDVDQRLIESVVLPSAQMSGLQRLQIYGRAYFGRLIECLQAQFPAVRHAIGDDAFNAMASGYLAQNPSTNYSLGSFGQSFDAFLTSTRPAPSDEFGSGQSDFADFLIDLAKLEWIYAHVFNGKGPETSDWLSATDLVELSAEEFANSRLVPFECVRLHEFRFPVHEYISAIRRGTDVTPPESRPTYLVITRRDYIVRRIEVNRQQFDLLGSLLNGATIGESLTQLCDDPDVDLGTLKSDLRNWFREWTAAPLFARRISQDNFSPDTVNPLV